MLLMLLPPVSGNVSTSSGAYVAPGGYSRRRTQSRLASWVLVLCRSLAAVLAMCTREPLMARRFASNVYGYMLGMDQRKPLKYTVDAVTFFIRHR